MNRLQKTLIVVLAFSFANVFDSIKAQDTTDQLNFNLGVNHVALSIERDKVKNATSISDLNRHFKSEWVKEYYQVSFQCPVNGTMKTINTSSDKLNQELKDMILACDASKRLEINIEYLPNNELRHNDPKKLHYSILIRPDIEASFSTTSDNFNDFIIEHAIHKIDRNYFTDYRAAIISFTIDTAGDVINPIVFESSKNTAIDSILLNAICNMPKWTPASYNDGTKVSQNFALTIGSMDNCNNYRLNTDREE